jgi:hypothetical protein
MSCHSLRKNPTPLVNCGGYTYFCKEVLEGGVIQTYQGRPQKLAVMQSQEKIAAVG